MSRDRLERIKSINEDAIIEHDNGDPKMELSDIVMQLWQAEDIDWLIEQAEELEKARAHILRHYRIGGASPDIDWQLWKASENYLGGREMARRALEDEVNGR